MSFRDLVSTRMLSASKRLRDVETALTLSMVTSEAEIPAAFAIDCIGAGVGESTDGITREQEGVGKRGRKGARCFV
jgi:hypothetical protein